MDTYLLSQYKIKLSKFVEEIILKAALIGIFSHTVAAE